MWSSHPGGSNPSVYYDFGLLRFVDRHACLESACLCFRCYNCVCDGNVGGLVANWLQIYCVCVCVV